MIIKLLQEIRFGFRASQFLRLTAVFFLSMVDFVGSISLLIFDDSGDLNGWLKEPKYWILQVFQDNRNTHNLHYVK